MERSPSNHLFQGLGLVAVLWDWMILLSILVFRGSDSFGSDEKAEGGIDSREDWVWVWSSLEFGGYR